MAEIETRAQVESLAQEIEDARFDLEAAMEKLDGLLDDACDVLHVYREEPHGRTDASFGKARPDYNVLDAIRSIEYELGTAAGSYPDDDD